MRRKVSTLLGLTLLVALALSAPARADVTLGSTAVPSEAAPGPCPPDLVIGQSTDNPATPYKVPATGRITGWQINTTGASPGAPVALVVMRDNGAGSTVVGVSPQTLPAQLPPVAAFTLSSPIPVAAGDTLGLFTDGVSEVVCYWIRGSVPEESTLFSRNAAALPAPGQFLSPFSSDSPGGHTMNVAANWTPPTKKCKKRNKGKGKAKKDAAEIAKGNGCKKRKKGRGRKGK